LLAAGADVGLHRSNNVGLPVGQPVRPYDVTRQQASYSCYLIADSTYDDAIAWASVRAFGADQQENTTDQRYDEESPGADSKLESCITTIALCGSLRRLLIAAVPS